MKHDRHGLLDRILAGILALALFAGMTVAVCPFMIRVLKTASADIPAHNAVALSVPGLMPWNSIGGCGAGGGGGGGGGGPKWVGTGVSGGLLDVEVMYTSTIGQNSQNRSLSTRFSGKPNWKWTLGASIPFNSKIGEVQYQTNQQEKYAITGGLGDISVDIARTLGAEGQFSLSLGVTMPTGQYDIQRGPDIAKYYLPDNLQNGTGTWNAALGLSYSKDVEDGIWLFDIGYSHPFMMRLFSGENYYVDDYYTDYKDSTDNARFYYRFKYYGENDHGAYFPPGISASVFYGYRGIKNYVHSWGVSFSAPLNDAWKSNENPYYYNPEPHPFHFAWSGAFNYGIEFSRREYPFFISIIKPIHEQADAATTRWQGPDWKDFLHSWSLAIGVKSTMF